MIRQRGMIDLFHPRAIGQKFYHLLRALGMAIKAQGQSLHTLQQQEGMSQRIMKLRLSLRIVRSPFGILLLG